MLPRLSLVGGYKQATPFEHQNRWPPYQLQLQLYPLYMQGN